MKTFKMTLLILCAGLVLPSFSTKTAEAQNNPNQCANPKESRVLVSSTPVKVPTTRKADSKYIYICNSDENAGTDAIKCTIDGTKPVLGGSTAGSYLVKGKCQAYFVAPNATAVCVSTGSNTIVEATDC